MKQIDIIETNRNGGPGYLICQEVGPSVETRQQTSAIFVPDTAKIADEMRYLIIQRWNFEQSEAWEYGNIVTVNKGTAMAIPGAPGLFRIAKQSVLDWEPYEEIATI